MPERTVHERGVRVKRVAVTTALVLLGTGVAAPARAAEDAKGRIAVLVLSAGVEPELGDNLTEVVIAEVARLGGYEIAGKEEFRAKLGVADERRALACVGELACLSRAGAALGVTRVLAGTVGQRGGDYLFSLSLLDLTTGHTDNQAFKLVSGGVGELVRVAGEVAARIFERRPEPGALRVRAQAQSAHVYLDDVFIGTTPVRSPPVEVGSHRLRVEAENRLGWARTVEVPSGQTLEIELGADALPARREWPRNLAIGTGAGAVLAASAGGFLAVLSQERPTGTDRRDVLADVDHKHTQAVAANVLFGVAGALAITSGLTLYRYRRDIFGGRGEAQVALVPTGVELAARF
jgi:hypothetical protein